MKTQHEQTDKLLNDAAEHIKAATALIHDAAKVEAAVKKKSSDPQNSSRTVRKLQEFEDQLRQISAKL